MQRLPSILSCALALVASTALAGPGDVVFQQSPHGHPTTGVNRVATAPVGHCLQCHPTRALPVSIPNILFTANDNPLCFTCHGAAGQAAYLGPAAYNATAHWTSMKMLWPGPVPAARPVADQGKCLNCHTPHGRRDGQGLVPDLGYVREEALCLACHDSNGPASSNLVAELGKARSHPVTTIVGKHLSTEPTTGATFGGANRHAECVDCHNPHAASDTAKLAGVARVAVTNGAAGTTPAFTLKGPTDASAVKEEELCFKCHSAWTTLPAGKTDKAVELNPANESFHPVEAAGKNATAAMTASLLGGTGNPKLTPTSLITCSDCHNSEAIPLTISKVSSYTGLVPSGPHGSNASAASATLSTALLRAPYRVTPKNGGSYVASESTLCFICHAAAPFADNSKNNRADTNFKLHGYHLGKGLICAECHSNSHGNRLAGYSTNRTYSRLVSYSSNVLGTGGAGSQPTWTLGSKSCSAVCHGKNHNPETY